MTDPTIELTVEAVTLLAFEVWTDAGLWRERLAPPPPCRAAETSRGRLLAVEPRTWWLRPSGERDAALDDLGRVLDGAGAVFDISGTLRRIRLSSTDWRERLSIGGVLDTRPEVLPIGAVAGSVLHHAPVRLDVVGAEIVDLYTPPSFVEHLLHHLA